MTHERDHTFRLGDVSVCVQNTKTPGFTFHAVLGGSSPRLRLEPSVPKLSLLTEAERHKLIVEWNDTERDYSGDKTIHQLFEEQPYSPDCVE